MRIREGLLSCFSCVRPPKKEDLEGEEKEAEEALPQKAEDTYKEQHLPVKKKSEVAEASAHEDKDEATKTSCPLPQETAQTREAEESVLFSRREEAQKAEVPEGNENIDNGQKADKCEAEQQRLVGEASQDEFENQDQGLESVQDHEDLLKEEQELKQFEELEESLAGTSLTSPAEEADMVVTAIGNNGSRSEDTHKPSNLEEANLAAEPEDPLTSVVETVVAKTSNGERSEELQGDVEVVKEDHGDEGAGQPGEGRHLWRASPGPAKTSGIPLPKGLRRGDSPVDENEGTERTPAPVLSTLPNGAGANANGSRIPTYPKWRQEPNFSSPPLPASDTTPERAPQRRLPAPKVSGSKMSGTPGGTRIPKPSPASSKIPTPARKTSESRLPKRIG